VVARTLPAQQTQGAVSLCNGTWRAAHLRCAGSDLVAVVTAGLHADPIQAWLPLFTFNRYVLGAVVRAACKAFDPSFKSDCVQLDRTSVVLCASIAGALERRLLRYGGIAEKARL
jgi:hypothetical protein